MTITPINTAAALFLEAQASGTDSWVPTADVAHPELARLLMIRLESGSISDAEYQQSVSATGWSKRHLQRQLAGLFKTSASTVEPRRQKFTLSDHHKQVVMACGNVQLAYNQLTDNGEKLPSYETFWRGFDALPSGVRAYFRHGAEGIVGFWLYPPFEAPARNEVWQADHFELPVDVIADGCTATLVKPWITIFEDDRTRMVMSWALVAGPGERPGAEVICATICDGVRIRLEDGVEVGGVPRIIRWDNDLALNAGSVIQLGTALGFECHAVPPYSGHMKGKIERLGRRVQESFCVLQPGYTHGPKTYTSKDLFRDTPPLTAAELRARLSVWFAEYNQTLHQGHHKIPLAAWAAETAPLRRASDAQLRSALLVAPQAYKIHKRKGVHFAGKWWQGAGMLDIVGRRVEVRYPINDDSFIEIFYQGKWACTGWPARTLTDSQKESLWDGRQEMYSAVRQLHDQAREIRVGADVRTATTDATPSMASMPELDRLAGNSDELYRLLGRLEPSEDSVEAVESPLSSPGETGVAP